MNKVDGKLNLWVFGPGTGEFIAVHVPPDGWLSIDGCSAAGELYPSLFFNAMGVAPTHILMTHPHLDHARGVRRLVDEHTGAQLNQWPRLGLMAPPRAKVSGGASQEGYDGQVAAGVLTAMKTRWRRRPTCRWRPGVGSLEPLGAGQLRILSPEPAALKARRGERFDWNRLATALALEWSNQRLILASDLVESPGGGWTSVLKRMPEAREHIVLKVAHHGSRKAQHQPLLARISGEAKVVMLATPFAGEKLPKFGKNEGADVLLRHTGKLLLTGLPQKFETQNGIPRQWKRSRLNRMRKPIAYDDEVGPFPACYLQLVLDASGKTKLTYGPGSVIVHAG